MDLSTHSWDSTSRGGFTRTFLFILYNHTTNMHFESDQLVTLTTTTPHRAVRITGITPDHGLLRTVPEKTSEQEFINLQPDGNSFDIMAGLIHLKK